LGSDAHSKPEAVLVRTYPVVPVEIKVFNCAAVNVVASFPPYPSVIVPAKDSFPYQSTVIAFARASSAVPLPIIKA